MRSSPPPLPPRASRDNPLIVDARSPRPADPATRARLAEALVATGQEDRAAFRTLYDLTSAKLYGVILRICHDRQAAEEVLSDVYLTVWKRAGAYEPGRASPVTWLATIARNRAIDWRRASGRRPSTPLTEVPDIADDRAAAIDTLLPGESDRKLHLCLDQLDEKPRAAIRAAFFEGATYAELAERQNIPLGTMKSWVRRGLLRLKDCLDDPD